MRKRWVVGACLILLISVGSLIPFHYRLNQLRTLMSLRQIDDHPLFVMRFYGGYDFADYLQGDARAVTSVRTSRQETMGSWACTGFSSWNMDGHYIMGRNFDWYIHPGMLLFTDPPDGYASVSMGKKFDEVHEFKLR